MELPLIYKAKIESMFEGMKIAPLKETSFEITDDYKNEVQKGKHLIDDVLKAKVYSLMRMPATFGAVYDVLLNTKEFYDGEISSLIDVGAGTGAATIAANELFNLKEITLLERQKEMREIGEFIVSENEALKSQSTWDMFDLSTENIQKKADLVMASYVFNELDPKYIKEAILKMWNAANKLLVIVEPGTPLGSKIIQEIRNILITDGGYIVAPCPHMDKCPMNENDWCHFSTRVSRSKLYKQVKGVEVPYEDEKYSYIVFSKNVCSRCSARVIRHPYYSKANVRLEVCSQNGLETLDIRKKDERYKKARKVNAGDSL